MNRSAGMSIAVVFLVAGCGSAPTPPPQTVTVTTTMPASEVEQQRIDRQQQDMDRRAAELDEREAAIATSEAIAAESTFSGDGTFLVGQEIMPGTWRSQGSEDPTLLPLHRAASSPTKTPKGRPSSPSSPPTWRSRRTGAGHGRGSASRVGRRSARRLRGSPPGRGLRKCPR